MSIEVTCVQCGSSHLVNDRLAGRRVRCPNCDTAVHVPEVEHAVEVDPVVEVDPIEVEPVAVATESPTFAADPARVGAQLGLSQVAPAALTIPGSASPVPGSASPVPGSASPVPGSASPAVMEDDEDEDDEVLPRKERPEEEMDMTPMVDVTFLLLIFFMVTAAFSLQKSIEMPRQQTDAPSTTVVEDEVEELDMVEVQVDEFGSFLVMAPEWERETPGKQNLISALKEAIVGNNDGMRLVVKVHEQAKLHALVDAMDAGTIAGYAQLEVTQVEEFD